MRLVQPFVEESVVETSVDPVDETVGEQNESDDRPGDAHPTFNNRKPARASVTSKRHPMTVELIVTRLGNIVVQSRVATNFGEKEKRREEAHQRNTLQRVHGFLVRLVLQECIIRVSKQYRSCSCNITKEFNA